MDLSRKNRKYDLMVAKEIESSAIHLDSEGTSYRNSSTKMRQNIKPNFMITNIETGKSPIKFKMARNSSFKLPEPEENNLPFSSPKKRNNLSSVKKNMPRTVKARDGDYIQINPDSGSESFRLI